ncbi:hypothetical protein T440DRAFT_235536 [Plenodomus tracheiphilus IPT5]|uniref:Uncharacterized protein n=1 Tax=Plenodomus tracheiphilus IPT5 TaxID=1408161 RepID=A0A6A7BG84_9PLEO|nr:hypothetical protein T440DRAFT_235536 [Plenodomus tracheiphilus IPT5]
MAHPGKPVERCAPTLHTNARPSVCVHISLFYRVPLAAFLVCKVYTPTFSSHLIAFLGFFLGPLYIYGLCSDRPLFGSSSPSSHSTVSLLRTAIHSFHLLSPNLHLLCIQVRLIPTTIYTVSPSTHSKASTVQAPHDITPT